MPVPNNTNQSMGDPSHSRLYNIGSAGEAWTVNYEPRQLLQVAVIEQAYEEKAYFVDFVPPSRDAIELPRHVVYVLVGVALVVVATYAIVGHLIDDLMHDLADWVLGPKSIEADAEGAVEGEDERGSLYDGGIKTKEDGINPERFGMLPGFHHVARNDLLTSLTLCGTIPARPSERRTSIQEEL
ncbi:hypothetical protein DPEC_G00060070 [Dallia pectoralis]|uniref:Uncharacterized protein n=1 Tax=Dallia pectoralis TaxID=75939 RepID=A0ACC2H6W6_DALPE|nr:hypothetical protein DPEC_G00060070 [Dallia pectoralis]